MYTFEMHFSGLCLLQLLDEDTKRLQAHLVNATEIGTSCEADIKLPKHKPELVFDTNEVEITGNGLSDCDKKGSIWRCCLKEKEFEVVLDGGDSFCNPSKRGNEPYPRRGVPPSDFGWVGNLSKMDRHYEGLKPEVGQSVKKNDLVTSRFHINKGESFTEILGYTRQGPLAVWELRPPGRQVANDHPKALAEVVGVIVKDLQEDSRVILRDLDDGSELHFKPRRNRLILRVQNRPCGDAYGPSVGVPPHPHRLRHFLWYWNLVKWKDGECPEPLVAPICPGGDCYKRTTLGAVEAGNHFCPPTCC